MTFEFTPELQEYIHTKGKPVLAVTVASTENSDLNVEELYLRLVSEKDAKYMIEKQHFHPYDSDVCKVLLPNYRLVYSPVVKFYLKKFLCFRLIKCEGIKF